MQIRQDTSPNSVGTMSAEMIDSDQADQDLEAGTPHSENNSETDDDDSEPASKADKREDRSSSSSSSDDAVSAQAGGDE